MAEETANNQPVQETAEPVQEAPAPEGEGNFIPQKPKGFWGKVDEWFGITKSGSNYRTEIVAGLTTFMAMVYILMVNAGMFQGVIVPAKSITAQHI